jgi:hypothetical protein
MEMNKRYLIERDETGRIKGTYALIDGRLFIVRFSLSSKAESDDTFFKEERERLNHGHC